VVVTPWRALAVAGLLGLAACGGADNAGVSTRPQLVPDNIVPAKIQGDQLAFFENTSEGVKNGFANAGSNSLVADGRLWELRKNDVLVGVLQLATVMPAVDLEQKSHREKVVHSILGADPIEMAVDDTTVWMVESNDKSTFIWFGQSTFAVLSLKGGVDVVKPQEIIDEVTRYIVASENWEPLYIDPAEAS
jgi:hypothetical protein